MGQIIRKEIVGLLQKTGLTVVSLGQSVLNIGGQQYATQSTLLCDISTSGFGGLDIGSAAAASTYHIYAVINGGGAVGLVASLNLPIANGPVGFPTWKYLWSVHTKFATTEILSFIRAGKKNVFTDSTTLGPGADAQLVFENTNLSNGNTNSNSAAITSAMLNGISDQYEAQMFFHFGAGGTTEWNVQLFDSLTNNVIFGAGSSASSNDKEGAGRYTGKVGNLYYYTVVYTNAPGAHDIAQWLVSYDNKLVDESSSAGTIVNIGSGLPLPQNELWLRLANGYGSVNTFQKRWVAIQTNVGTAFTYKDDPALGTTITINEDGLYNFFMTENTNSNSQFGITLNQTDPTKAISQIVNGAEVLMSNYTTAAQLFMTSGGTKFLHAGDVLRTLSDAAGPGTYTELVGFRIEKVANSGAQGVVSIGPRTEIFWYGGNGHGSTDTHIRRFATQVSTSGTDVTVTDNAANGTFFTINTPGLYAISYEDASSTGAAAGLTKNSPNLTVPVSDPSNDAYRLISSSVSGAGANQPAMVAVTLFLNTGDVIRAHNDSASTPDGTSNNGTTFRITKVNN